MPDIELQAMSAMVGLMEPLTPEMRDRILRWAADRYGLPAEAPLTPSREDLPLASAEDFPDLFHRANPVTNAQRALVASYWLSQRGEGVSFSGQELNGLLKNLGYQIPNITDAVSQCMRERPALIIQTRKSGSSQQARKSYRITDAGQRRVAAMLGTEAPGIDNQEI